MNIYLMVDAEGISGIFSSEQVTEDGNRRMEGQRMMTADINACVNACKEAGIDKVYVRDCHGGANSVLYDELTDEANYYILGRTGTDRFVGLDDCDGVILLGYHAMAGTYGGVLEHSMSSKGIQHYWINGEVAGETAIDAAIVGDRGKPVIMVSGCDKLCAEAKALLPWVVTCEVKKGVTWGGAMLLPRGKAHALIREKTIEAVKNFARMKPYVVAKPVVFRTEMVERGILPSKYSKPYMRIIDGHTYEVEGATMEEALYRA